jgi:hypothetical protein
MEKEKSLMEKIDESYGYEPEEEEEEGDTSKKIMDAIKAKAENLTKKSRKLI